jgi:hypothetical protein
MAEAPSCGSTRRHYASEAATQNVPASHANSPAVIDCPQCVIRRLLLHSASRELIASFHVRHVLSDIATDAIGGLLIILPLCLESFQRAP